MPLQNVCVDDLTGGMLLVVSVDTTRCTYQMQVEGACVLLAPGRLVNGV